MLQTLLHDWWNKETELTSSDEKMLKFQEKACHEITTNDRKMPILEFPQDYTNHDGFGTYVNLTVSNILYVNKSSRDLISRLPKMFHFTWI